MLYGCTTWTLTKRLKKLDGNYTRMLRAILNKSWRQHPTRHQLYGQLPPVTKTIQVRRTRHARHCWRSKDELISDVLLWTPAYGQAKAGWPARTNIQQLCEDTGCSRDDLPEAMNDWEKWRERVRDIRANVTTWWWWWWWCLCLCACVPKFACYWMLEYLCMCCCSNVNIYVGLPIYWAASLYIYSYFPCQLWGRGETKERSVKREDWVMARLQTMDRKHNNQIFDVNFGRYDPQRYANSHTFTTI